MIQALFAGQKQLFEIQASEEPLEALCSFPPVALRCVFGPCALVTGAELLE